MSPATDGFSAMMSFLAMQRERPQMISANRKRVQPAARESPLACACVRAREALVRESGVRGGEQILGEEPARRCLLVPQHHQHDELQLLERQGLARGGERSLENELAGLRREDAGVLERQQEAAAFHVELRQLSRREGAKASPRVGQRARRRRRRAQHAGKPVQSLADVRILEPRRGELLCHPFSVICEFGLLAVLEQEHEDVVHKASLFYNAVTGIGFTLTASSRAAGTAPRATPRPCLRAPDAEARRPPARPTSPPARKGNPRPPDRGPCGRAGPKRRSYRATPRRRWLTRSRSPENPTTPQGRPRRIPRALRPT